MTAKLAKLSPPRTSRIVVRPRLFHDLDKIRLRRVLWIVGPPGAGKTALVASWRNERKLRCLWVQLEQGDSDPATFFHYLEVAAGDGRARSGLPSFGQADLRSPGAFARRFFRALFARRSPPSVIVLDDYHELHCESLVHTALCEGLREFPPGAGLVVTSRGEPPPAILKLEIGQQLETVRGDKLLLTPAETAALARRWGVSGGDRRSILALHAESRGWVAGLVLLLAGLRDGLPEHRGGAWEEALFDYLAEEFFNRATPTTRTVLLETAFLHRITADMAVSLTGLDDAGAILADLSRRGYFVSHYPCSSPTYELHSLFRRFLRLRAARTLSKDRQRDLRLRAARELEHDGQPMDALDLYITLEDWEDATRVILAVAPALIDGARQQTLSAVMSRVPEQHWRDNPFLVFFFGLSKMFEEPALARVYEERALGLFEEAGHASGVYGALAAVASTRQFQLEDLAPHDAWIEKLEEVRRRFPSCPFPKAEKSLVSMAVIATFYRQPANPHLPEWEQRALDLALATHIADVRWETCTALLVRYAWFAHKLHRARLLIDTFKSQLATSPAAPSSIIWWYLGQACMHLYLGEIEACRESVDRGLAAAAERDFLHWNPYLLVLRSQAALQASDPNAARAAMAGAMACAGDAARGIRCYVSSWASVLARHLGDSGLAREHGTMATQLATASGITLFEAPAKLARALAQPATIAEQELEEALALARRTDARLVQVGSLLALAVAAARRGVPGVAVERLREGLQLARDLGVVVIPFLVPRELTDCCALALEHGIEVDHVRALIAANRLAPGDKARELENWPRELHIEALRGLVLKRNGTPIEPSRKAPKKPLQLLQQLVAGGPRGVGQGALAEALWPDAEGDAAARALKVTLHRLRTLLGSAEAITQRDGRIAIDGSRVGVDLWCLNRLLDRIEKEQCRASTSSGELHDLCARLFAHDLDLDPGADDAEPALQAARERIRRRAMALRTRAYRQAPDAAEPQNGYP